MKEPSFPAVQFKAMTTRELLGAFFGEMGGGSGCFLCNEGESWPHMALPGAFLMSSRLSFEEKNEK